MSESITIDQFHTRSLAKEFMEQARPDRAMVCWYSIFVVKCYIDKLEETNDGTCHPKDDERNSL
ncbi:hypothetical protein PHYBLDRAFT_144905 [Phycomyces blakesleeanus NRRL 1555(-)]|uniref:Uncharacterized protein n=1 Tax=Phycomyces blakesleeanus (strain ATCC 8743b / DSM 1359 / FGSC 10004 / NBRC 33097 / NRRL 1555) TaxID=763407 RepID=A0A162PVK5_PHYB8|nr:hypothetical protein PHYBLDRAFT_144905 [Phycomyces blakesleeanus NRRL 1555(-)]OAD74456.1 hypothetical protein PHYBLDRAFT_144905 [Phycomyces blakesleeanus NRRL 1555(-)]|eukprot:XP_018292496.1 hypothetical protein PHYBLDRAFT_144905 [Phycomyces blakesleeanus NRRL 1555(-)]